MKPLLAIAAAPTVPATVATLTRQQGVREAIENPLFSRHNGFNLVTLDRARLLGDHLTVSSGTRKHLDLFNDGSFFAYATFDGFLAWPNRGREFVFRPKISSLALIEFVYDFALNYDRLLREHIELEARAGQTPRVRFTLCLHHAIFDNTALSLSPYGINSLSYLDDQHPAPAKTFTHDVDSDVAPNEPQAIDVGAVAFQLVRPFYNWFGLIDEQIPYSTDDRTRIDIERITSPQG